VGGGEGIEEEITEATVCMALRLFAGKFKEPLELFEWQTDLSDT
jgi:hypothetical protein